MASFVLEFLNPSEIICIARLTIIFSIAYTLNASFMFVKSQKLIQAFLSKVLITAEEARKTVSVQIFTNVMTVAISNVLMYIVYQMKPVFSSYQDEFKMLRIHFCDTCFHVFAITSVNMVITIACFVQAFRGRHLPSVMNDGMSLVYASFATIVMFAVMYIIVPFQKPVEKELYQNLTIMTNTLVIWFMMYGQKAIRMFRYPHQNTKKYFQEQRLHELRKRVDEKTTASCSSLTN